jgi:hypothetical protein
LIATEVNDRQETNAAAEPLFASPPHETGRVSRNPPPRSENPEGNSRSRSAA